MWNVPRDFASSAINGSGQSSQALTTLSCYDRRAGLTLLYLIKANLGPGLYAIPAAFKDAGLVGGSIGIPLMAALSVHCMHMLIKCTEVMKSRRGDPDISMDYPQVIETACLTGPSFFAKYSTFARSVFENVRFPH